MFIVFSSTRSPDGVVLGGLPIGLLITSSPQPANRRYYMGIPYSHIPPNRKQKAYSFLYILF